MPEDDATVESLTPLWRGANFLEREVWDLFGIRFIDHPDLRRVLLMKSFKVIRCAKIIRSIFASHRYLSARWREPSSMNGRKTNCCGLNRRWETRADRMGCRNYEG